MTPDEIELCMIREFSVSGNQIGKSSVRTERRERIRQAIYANGKFNDEFHNMGLTYAEAFRLCYRERLDRRAAMRALPEPPAIPGEDDEEGARAEGFHSRLDTEY